MSRRRRSAVLVASLICLQFAATAAGAPLSVILPQRAHAEWSVPGPRGAQRYTAEGIKLLGVAGDTRAAGFVGVIDCARGPSSRSCIGTSRIQYIPPSDFVVDPTLASARLVIGGFGQSDEVLWSDAELVPDAAAALSTRRLDVDAEGAVSRDSVAGGSVLGAEVLGRSTDSSTSIAVGAAAHVPEVVPLPDLLNRNAILLASGGGNCSPTSTERAFAKLTNNARSSARLGGLRVETALTAAARRHSKDMARRNKLVHTSPAKLTSSLLGWKLLGENVGVGGSPSSIQKAFLQSPLHRGNILQNAFRYIGVGTAKSSSGKLWVTVLFASGKGTTGSLSSC